MARVSFRLFSVSRGPNGPGWFGCLARQLRRCQRSRAWDLVERASKIAKVSEGDALLWFVRWTDSGLSWHEWQRARLRAACFDSPTRRWDAHAAAPPESEKQIQRVRKKKKCGSHRAVRQTIERRGGKRLARRGTRRACCQKCLASPKGRRTRTRFDAPKNAFPLLRCRGVR
jgi:hypothetical protein